MNGENRRVREKVKTVVERVHDRSRLPSPNVPMMVKGTPAIVAPDKKLKFGAATIKPGGFLAG